LKRANVVDAGALGFVELLTGMVGYLDTGIEPDEGLSDNTTAVEHDERTTAGETGDLTHRWCTECLVLARDADTADQLWIVEHPPVVTLGQAGLHGKIGFRKIDRVFVSAHEKRKRLSVGDRWVNATK
jgi:lipoate-protein ligase B